MFVFFQDVGSGSGAAGVSKSASQSADEIADQNAVLARQKQEAERRNAVVVQKE